MLQGTANMIRLDTYRGNLTLIGFLLLVKCLRVWSRNFTSLDALSSTLNVNDTLVSTPLGHFELGIFPLYTDTPGSNYLCIRYKLPIEQATTWLANRDNPVSDISTLQFSNDGNLVLIDPQNNTDDNIWSTKTGGLEAVNVQLNDTGNLVLMDINGVIIWSSFNNSPPTDTLLPGQYMYRNQNNKLTSWQKNGNPATSSGSYSFGWENGDILALSWTMPKTFINWKGGSYIPAPDVHDAHTISDVEYVYFHETLGHLYISSEPSNTAILSGGPDRVSNTTLKRIEIGNDGGFRIWQWTVGQNATSSWTAIANWVVSDRPDSRSQCTSFGTCGPYGMCTSAMDSLDPVVCGCPSGFQPINGDPAQGCFLPQSTSNTNCTNATMLQLDGFDMPWSGDYENLTGSDSVNCKDACMNDCNCNGAVYSSMEQMCWKKTGFMYNLGYPTVALHGNDRTAYIKNVWNPASSEPPQVSKAKHRLPLVAIVVLAVVGGVFLLVGTSMILRLLVRRKGVRPGCGLCCSWRARRAQSPEQFPGSPSISRVSSF